MYEIGTLEYIFIAFNIIIIAGVLYFLYRTSQTQNEKETIEEPFNIGGVNYPDPPSLGDIENKLKGPFDEVNKKFQEAGNKMKDGINDAIDAVKKQVLGPLTEIFNKAKQAFEEIPNRFSRFGRAFDHIFIGIGEEVTGLFDGIGDGFVDIGQLIEYSGIFVFTYMACGVKLIRNLHKCMFYYALQAAGQMFYLPMRIILWVFSNLGADMYSTEAWVWNNLEELDSAFFESTGVHFMHFSLEVRENCYNCRRLKKEALKKKASDIDRDFRVGIKEKLNKGINTLTRAGDEFKGVFM